MNERAAEREPDTADRNSNAAAAALSFALPGDTVLYLLLPLHLAAFGVSLPEAGLLLAANRLVRIAGYGWVARFYQSRGPRAACSAAVVAAAGSALGYALLSGVVALLAARLLWGLAFAALNIATQVLATQRLDGAARRSGRSRAIISIGPMLGLLGGALLSQWIGPRPVFVLLAIAALAALAFTRRLPAGPGAQVSGAPRFALPSRLDSWSFVQGLTLDGLFVVGLSVLASATLPHDAALAAGAALALRYLSEIVLGPVGGASAERWGATPLLVGLSLASAAGLFVIGVGALWSGALTVIVLRGLLQPLPAPVAAQRYSGEERVIGIARLATWRDLGAGVGPLIAGIALPLLPNAVTYGLAALMLMLASLAVGVRRG